MRNLILFFTFLTFSSTMFSQVNQEISYTTSFDSNLIYSRVDTFTTTGADRVSNNWSDKKLTATRARNSTGIIIGIGSGTNDWAIFLVIRHEINNKEKIYTNSFVNFDGKTNYLIIESDDTRANYRSDLIFVYESRSNDDVTITYETLNDEIVYLNYKIVNNIKIPTSVSVHSRFRTGIMYMNQ